MSLNKNFLKRIWIKRTETIQRTQEDWKEWSKERLWKTAEVILGESRKGRKEQTMTLRVEVEETIWWRHAPETPRTVWILELGCLWSNLKSLLYFLTVMWSLLFPRSIPEKPCVCTFVINSEYWNHLQVNFFILQQISSPKLTRGHIC